MSDVIYDDNGVPDPDAMYIEAMASEQAHKERRLLEVAPRLLDELRRVVGNGKLIRGSLERLGKWMHYIDTGKGE